MSRFLIAWLASTAMAAGAQAQTPQPSSRPEATLAPPAFTDLVERIERSGEADAPLDIDQAREHLRHDESNECRLPLQPIAASEGGQPDNADNAPAPAPVPEKPSVLTGSEPPLTASKVRGLAVWTEASQRLGDVDRVVTGKDNRGYVIIGHGGFLGIGVRHVALPIDRLRFTGDRLQVSGVTEAQLQEMPDVGDTPDYRDMPDDRIVQVRQ